MENRRSYIYGVTKRIRVASRIGVAGRIAVAITFAVLIVAVLIVVAVRYQLETQIKSASEQQLQMVLDKESEALNQEFLRVKRLAHALSQLAKNQYGSLKESQNAPLTGSKPEGIEQLKNQLIPQVKDLISVFDNISGWILFNSEEIPGVHTVSYTFEGNAFKREAEYDAVGEGYSKEPWWTEAIQRGEYWTKPYYWEPWDADIISYSVPVFSGDKLIAVAGAEFFTKPFQERLRQIRVYDTGFVMLIDSQGEPVYLPAETDKELLGSWYKNNEKKLLSQASGIDYLGEGSFINQQVVAWQRLDNRWLLIAQPKASEMFSAVQKVYRVLLVIFLLTIPLAIMLGAIMSRSLTKRLRALIHTSEHLLKNLVSPKKEMDLILLPDGNHDDLGLLNRTFNRLQQEVQESISALSLSESKYRSLVEYSEQLIFTLDAEGRFLTTNRALETMSGFPKDALIGNHFTVMIASDEIKLFWEERFNHVIRTRQRVHTEAQMKTPDGKYRMLSVTLLPIISSQSDISAMSSIMVTASDLTERLDAEREVQRLLERDKAALSRLVAGIAHEMNTPLGNALVLLSYFDEVNISDAERQVALDSLKRNLQRVVDLVTNFKALSADHQREALVQIPLKSFITMLISEMDTQDIVSVKCDSDFSITTYPTALNQVLQLVIDNALIHGPILHLMQEKHPSSEERQVTGYHVQVIVTKGLNSLTITIEDNGQGMTENILTHCFDPFFTTKRGINHSGLGLSIAYIAATQVLKGKLTATSVPHPEAGHGTTLTISLPLIY